MKLNGAPGERGAKAAQHDVCVGIGRLNAALIVAGRTGREPADCGPLRNEPPLSIQAKRTATRPIVSTSMLGKQIG